MSWSVLKLKNENAKLRASVKELETRLAAAAPFKALYTEQAVKLQELEEDLDVLADQLAEHQAVVKAVRLQRQGRCVLCGNERTTLTTYVCYTCERGGENGSWMLRMDALPLAVQQAVGWIPAGAPAEHKVGFESGTYPEV